MRKLFLGVPVVLAALLFSSVPVADAPAVTLDSRKARNGKLLFVRDWRLWTINPDGSGETEVVPRDDLSATDKFRYHPAWSPDGRRIAFARRGSGYGDIFVMDADGTDVERLTPQRGHDEKPTWSPSGKRIAFVARRGRETRTQALWVMRSDGSRQHKVFGDMFNVQAPAWSPRGGEIAFSGARTRRSDYDIYILDLKTREVRRITDRGTNDVVPDWAPGGTRLAYNTYQTGQKIFTIRRDGSHNRRLETRRDWREEIAAWSPNGAFLAFTTRNDLESRIRIVRLEGPGEEQIVHSDDVDIFALDWQPIPRD